MKLIFNCLALLILPFILKSQSYNDVIPLEDKVFGLSKVWSEVTYNFAFIDKVDFDVDSLYKATIPKVIEARNNKEYINVLREFLSRFNNSKTYVMGSQWMYDETDTPAIVFDRAVDCCVIQRVETSLKEKIPPNSKVISVDGKEPTRNLRGEQNTAVALEIITPNGDTLMEAVIRNWSQRRKNGEKIKLYPPFENNPQIKFSYSELEEYSIVTVNTFSDSTVVEEFRKRIDTINQSKGLIIDLRQNGGGDSENAKAIAVHLVERGYIVGPSWKTRIHNAAKKAFGGSRHQGYKNDPRVIENEDFHNNLAYEIHPPDTVHISHKTKKISAPIVVLQSKSTVSAAEDFLIYTMGNKNIMRIGQTSKGNSGQPLKVDLGSGVFISIVAKRDALPNGEDYIGIGIKPEIEFEPGENVITHALKFLKTRQ